MSAGFSRCTCHPAPLRSCCTFFVAEYSPSQKTGNGGGAEHEEENIEVLEIHIDEAMRMIDSGEIKDGKTIILLQYVKLHNLI